MRYGVLGTGMVGQTIGDNLAGKVLIDVSNPLDFSKGMPPTLSVCNDDSVAEQIQAAYPDAKVVKTLNTVNASVMVAPGQLAEPTAIFVAGNDADAKRKTRRSSTSRSSARRPRLRLLA